MLLAPSCHQTSGTAFGLTPQVRHSSPLRPLQLRYQASSARRALRCPAWKSSNPRAPWHGSSNASRASGTTSDGRCGGLEVVPRGRLTQCAWPSVFDPVLTLARFLLFLTCWVEGVLPFTGSEELSFTFGGRVGVGHSGSHSGASHSCRRVVSMEAFTGPFRRLQRSGRTQHRRVENLKPIPTSRICFGP